VAIPNPRACTYALLRRLPLSSDSFTRRIHCQILARLACLIHAANVHSEPGSNPSKICLNQQHLKACQLRTKKSVIPVCRPGQRAAAFLLAKTHRLTISIELSKIFCFQKHSVSRCFCFSPAGFQRRGGSVSSCEVLSIVNATELTNFLSTSKHFKLSNPFNAEFASSFIELPPNRWTN